MKRVVLSLLILVAISLNAQNSQIDAFIERLYQNILGRDADTEGLNTWRDKLENQGWSATEVAKFFYDSPEFQNLNLSDSEFLDRTYRTFFNREADKGGKAYWLDQLQSFGKKRESVFYGFALSDEFKNLCKTYGVKAYKPEDGIKAFTIRFYNIILKRKSDPGGLDYWVKKLKNKEASGVDIAKFFFNSKEYLSSNPSDDQFITDAYKTMLDRMPDSDGFSFWRGLLSKGYSRDKIIYMMADSDEFKSIEKKYLNFSDEENSGEAKEQGECFVQITGVVPNHFGKVRPKKEEFDMNKDNIVDSISFYIYDENNCILKSTLKGRNDKTKEMEDMGETIYEYDQNKHLIVSKQYFKVNGTLSEFSRTYYEYYPNGKYKTIKTDSYPIDGIYSSIIKYNQDHTLMEEDVDADGKTDIKIQYFYKNNKIYKQITDDLIQGKKIYSTYVYDDKGNLIEIDKDENNDGEIDEKTVFKYDKYNNPIKIKNENLSDETKTLITTINYDYSNFIKTSISEDISQKTVFEKY